jgi:integrase
MTNRLIDVPAAKAPPPAGNMLATPPETGQPEKRRRSRVTLSDRTLKALKKPVFPKDHPKADQQLASHEHFDVMDADTGGFGVRVSATGRRTFILVARFGGKNPVRRAIGEYPAIGLAEAREIAGEWKRMLKRGVDPAEEAERQRRAALEKRQNTFGAVLNDFVREKLKSERRGGEVERDLRRECAPLWAARPIAEITARDVRNLIIAVRDRGAPYQARNVLGYVRRLFRWAIDQECYGLESSPCERIKPNALLGEKKARQRILSDDEIRAFWRAAGRLPYPYGATCRLLLLTGQRHGEVAGIRRSELHPELLALIRRHAESGAAIAWNEVPADWKLWAIGAERFKSDAAHMVPLPDDACAIIATLPHFRRGDRLLSTSHGLKPTVVSDKAKRRLDAAMLRTLRALARIRGDDPEQIELKPWVLHDLRRTVRTHLSALRVQDHVAEMVIGHGRQGIQRVYDQHRYVEEMRSALAEWALRLRGIVAPKAGNVIPIKARG